MQRELAACLELWDSDRADRIAQVILPTVQRLIADAEKRAAATALRDAAEKIRALADGPVPAINDAFDAVVILRVEADRVGQP